MKHGYYADRELPKSVGINKAPIIDYKTNSHGYRCPEWEPMPDGKKNVVVLGCSHTLDKATQTTSTGYIIYHNITPLD